MHKIAYAVPSALAFILYHFYLRFAPFSTQLKLNFLLLMVLGSGFYIFTIFMDNLVNLRGIGITWAFLVTQMYFSTTTIVRRSN